MTTANFPITCQNMENIGRISCPAVASQAIAPIISPSKYPSRRSP